MNVLELKGGILNRVSQLRDETSLAELFEHAGRLLSTEEQEQQSDHWDSLPESERERMLKTVDDLRQGKIDTIPHEVVTEKYRQWH
jgi:hypothetical protein